MKRLAVLALSLSLLLLAACSKPAESAEPADAGAPSGAASSAQETAPRPTLNPQATAKAWTNPAGDESYDFGEAAAPTLQDGGALPDGPLPLYYGPHQESKTWADLAEITGIPEETLKANNPDAETDGEVLLHTEDLLLQTAYTLLPVETRTVTTASMGAGDVYTVSAELPDYAAILLAEGYDALEHLQLSRGYEPSAPYDETLYMAAKGARFTAYSDYLRYIGNVFTEEMAELFLTPEADGDGHYAGFSGSKGDALLFQPETRAASGTYRGVAYTHAAVYDASGTVVLAALALEAEDSQKADVSRIVYYPIRIVETEAGPRVAELYLMY